MDGCLAARDGTDCQAGLESWRCVEVYGGVPVLYRQVLVLRLWQWQQPPDVYRLRTWQELCISQYRYVHDGNAEEWVDLFRVT